MERQLLCLLILTSVPTINGQFGGFSSFPTHFNFQNQFPGMNGHTSYKTSSTFGSPSGYSFSSGPITGSGFVTSQSFGPGGYKRVSFSTGGDTGTGGFVSMGGGGAGGFSTMGGGGTGGFSSMGGHGTGGFVSTGSGGAGGFSSMEDEGTGGFDGMGNGGTGGFSNMGGGGTGGFSRMGGGGAGSFSRMGGGFPGGGFRTFGGFGNGGFPGFESFGSGGFPGFRGFGSGGFPGFRGFGSGGFPGFRSFGSGGFPGFKRFGSGGFPGVPVLSRMGGSDGFGGFSPFNMRNNLENMMKPMRINQLKMQMQNGFGGVTLVVSPDKTLIKKDGNTFECLGTVIGQQPYCQGQVQKFQARERRDYCYSERYSQQGDTICVAHNDQTGISFINNNGRVMCSGSDDRPALTMNIAEYQQMCGKLPWDTTYHYFPDPSQPSHIRLPNADLNCPRQDVCIFKRDRNSMFK